MTRLRSCYFCGTTGMLSEYETVPAGLRTGSTSRQVVLCDRCHTKLTEIVRPIVDRLEPGVASEQDSPGDDQSGDRPTGTIAPDASRSSDDRATQPEVTFAGTSGPDPTDRTPDGSAGSDDPVDGADTAGGTEAETASEQSTVADPADTEAADAAGTNGADVDAADGTDDADGTSTEGAAGTEDDAAERSDDAAEGTEPDADDGADTADVGTGRDDLDRVYHQLLRFLRNREFPIPRPEAEAVAQSAYDLTASEASQVIQRAVDRGVLDERDGQIYRN